MFEVKALLSYFSLFYFLLPFVAAQKIEWAKGVVSNIDIFPKGMGIDSLGNSYSFNNFTDTVFFDNQLIIPPNKEDYYDSNTFIIKLDSSGKWVWSSNIWGKYGVTGHDISVAPNGDFIVVGNFYQSICFQSGSDTITLNSNNINPEPFIAKFNSEGNLLFALQGNGSGAQYGEGESRATAIEIMANGDFVVAGFFRDSITFGNTTLVSSALGAKWNRNFFIVKFNSEGEVFWAASSSQPQNDYDDGWILYPIDLCTDKKGNIFLTAKLNGEVKFNDDFNNTTIYKEIGYLTPTVLLAKYDPDGKLLWAKTEGGDARIDPKGIACDKEGNLYFAGTFWYRDAIFGSIRLIKINSAELCLAKLNADGIVLWAKQAYSSLSSSGGGIAVDNNSNVFITGGFRGSTTFGEGANAITISAPEKQEVFISKFTTQGEIVWVSQSKPRTTWGAGGAGLSIVVDNNKNCYLSGFYITPITFDNITLPWRKFNDVFIAKIKDETDLPLTAQQLKNETFLSVFPNPTKGSFNLSYTGSKGTLYLKLRNLTGAVVYESIEETTTGNFIKQINLNSIAPGIYFIEVRTDKTMDVKKIVLN
jgi:hypothetical protein